MTIYRTILAKGYLPKELPPAFFSEDFATYAATRTGRSHLKDYSPADNLTECVAYRLALPSIEHRLLKIPHPSTFALLVSEVAKAFRRLLKKAGTSAFARSRPVYSTTDYRAVRTLIEPANLSRDRALSRAGSSFVLKTDISQFYPSLYTHAVGWSIDPKLRQKAHWQNRQLLGKRLDQLLMNMQGKVSQGIPIGNDVSFLLAEIVLGQVDKALRAHGRRAFRWYDDYEVACDSRADAELALAQLRNALATFNLRLNPRKTAIMELPLPSSERWQQPIVDASRGAHLSPSNMVRYFDTAFDLRREHAGEPLLLYAIGLLFRLTILSEPVLRVAESCLTQAILAEPGCAQKAFALLTFWMINNAPVSKETIAAAIERIILRHESIGASSDVSWALAFCIDNELPLSKKAGKVLSNFEDDCIAIQALHASTKKLLPGGFSPKALESELKTATLDGPHWIALYECARHNFLPALAPIVASNALFADMLAKRVSFYRRDVPRYASVVHPGGAPPWVVRAWITGNDPVDSDDPVTPATAPSADMAQGHLVELIRKDVRKIGGKRSVAEIVAGLLDRLPRDKVEPDATPDLYT